MQRRIDVLAGAEQVHDGQRIRRKRGLAEKRRLHFVEARPARLQRTSVAGAVSLRVGVRVGHGLSQALDLAAVRGAFPKLQPDDQEERQGQPDERAKGHDDGLAQALGRQLHAPSMGQRGTPRKLFNWHRTTLAQRIEKISLDISNTYESTTIYARLYSFTRI